MRDVINVDSNSKSEDTPNCKKCGGDGFTSEHGCNPNYPESCAYTCPVQVQCEACEATGLEPPQDTSLDDSLERLLIEYGVSGFKGHEEAIMAWHKSEVAKLLQVIENEVIGRNETYIELEYPKYDEDGELLWSKNAIKESRKQRMQMVVNRNEQRSLQRQALKKIKERL